MSKQTPILKQKNKRPEMPQIGVAVLFKRKDMKPEQAWGIAIYPIREGTEASPQPDYSVEPMVIWKGELKELSEGKFADARVLKLPASEKKE